MNEGKKTLVLIRHAKSSWANPLQSDFDRSLNERGEKDAPLMGERLLKLNILPDLIISSTAKRAAQTAKKIAQALHYDIGKIKWDDGLYHCIPQVLEETAIAQSDELQTVFIVAHNPGITDFVNELSDQFRIDNMPTCGVVATTIQAKSWAAFHSAQKEVFLFEYPKNL
ncbi:MAG: histidine phosphatase family protein [Bacteroidetes bacterium]|nr:histidine phosphatase family protein [Bacteroidota bacterium]